MGFAMDTIKINILNSWLFPFVVLGVMAIVVEAGWRTGALLKTRFGHEKSGSDDAIIGAIFGLLALLMAFYYSGASDRYDHRRQLIAEEVNTVGSAYDSVELLAEQDQSRLREDFKILVDRRIQLYKDVMATGALEQRLEKFGEIRSTIWQEAVKAVKDTPFPDKLVASQILPQISSMGDVLDAQMLALKFQPPRVVTISLMLRLLVGGFLTGYSLGVEHRRHWLLKTFFICLMVGAVYLILCLEYPLVSNIGLEDFELEFIKLRSQM